jgi:hypothetical protein
MRFINMVLILAISMVYSPVSAQTLIDLHNLPKDKLGDGEAYIYSDFDLKFSEKVDVQYKKEGLGYAVTDPLPPLTITKENIYVSYNGKVYYSKIINYRFKKTMDKYNILVVKAVGETLVPKNTYPAKNMVTFDGIDMKEFIKNVGTNAIYRVRNIDKYYDHIIAENKDEYFEFIIFAGGWLPVFISK